MVFCQKVSPTAKIINKYHIPIFFMRFFISIKVKDDDSRGTHTNINGIKREN